MTQLGHHLSNGTELGYQLSIMVTVRMTGRWCI
jgi:hypothetical protein